MPSEFLVPSLKVAIKVRLNNELSTEQRYLALEQLCETCVLCFHAIQTHKTRIKAWHDRNLYNKELSEGEKVLLYKPIGLKKKLKFTGLGPYVITKIFTNGAVQLSTLNGIPLDTVVNGSRLRKYWEFWKKKRGDSQSEYYS